VEQLLLFLNHPEKFRNPEKVTLARESESAFILPATDKSTLLAGHSEKTAKVIKVCCTYGSYF